LAEPVDKNLCDARYEALSEKTELCIMNVRTRLDGMDKALELRHEALRERVRNQIAVLGIVIVFISVIIQVLFRIVK